MVCMVFIIKQGALGYPEGVLYNLVRKTHVQMCISMWLGGGEWVLQVKCNHKSYRYT